MVEETPTQEPVESAAGEHEESAGAEKKAEAEEMNATREEGETTEPATGGKE
jgi:hypothetical protein